MQSALMKLRSTHEETQVIRFRSGVLYCGQAKVSLKTCHHLRRLVETFMEHGGYPLRRDTLVEAVYEVDIQSCSTRRIKSLRHNLIKLISRGRRYLRSHLGENELNLRWFVHDDFNGCYSLAQAAPACSSTLFAPPTRLKASNEVNERRPWLS